MSSQHREQLAEEQRRTAMRAAVENVEMIRASMRRLQELDAEEHELQRHAKQLCDRARRLHNETDYRARRRLAQFDASVREILTGDGGAEKKTMDPENSKRFNDLLMRITNIVRVSGQAELLVKIDQERKATEQQIKKVDDSERESRIEFKEDAVEVELDAITAKKEP